MPNSTTPTIDKPPEHAVGADEEPAGGANDDEAAAGVHYHGVHDYRTTASRAPLRLDLVVDTPLLRLIKFMRNVIAHAVKAGAPQAAAAEEEEQGEPAAKKRNKGRRRLRRVSVRSLQLGQRKIARTDEMDIAAKFLYRKPKKIVCQLHCHDAFVKINVLWSNIQAMRACFEDARFDTLRIQAKSSSEQYRAGRPPPGMHIQWRRWADLTSRTFCLEFDKGTLERSYGKMLYTDPLLIPLTLPPPGDDEEEEEEEYQATDTQRTRMITAAAPVPQSVDVEAAMIGSTGTGANSATHEYGGTQLYDSTELAHMHSLYR